jgi:hypothetical protein
MGVVFVAGYERDETTTEDTGLVGGVLLLE